MRFRARLELVESFFYATAKHRMFAPFAFLVQCYDAEPDWLTDDDRYRVLWLHKWMVVDLLDHPEISLDQLETVLDGMRSRYVAAGEGLAPVLSCAYVLHAHVHGAAASEARVPRVAPGAADAAVRLRGLRAGPAHLPPGRAGPAPGRRRRARSRGARRGRVLRAAAARRQHGAGVDRRARRRRDGRRVAPQRLPREPSQPRGDGRRRAAPGGPGPHRQRLPRPGRARGTARRAGPTVVADDRDAARRRGDAAAAHGGRRGGRRPAGPGARPGARARGRPPRPRRGAGAHHRAPVRRAQRHDGRRRPGPGLDHGARPAGPPARHAPTPTGRRPRSSTCRGSRRIPRSRRTSTWTPWTSPRWRTSPPSRSASRTARPGTGWPRTGRRAARRRRAVVRARADLDAFCAWSSIDPEPELTQSAARLYRELGDEAEAVLVELLGDLRAGLPIDARSRCSRRWTPPGRAASAPWSAPGWPSTRPTSSPPGCAPRPWTCWPRSAS